MSRIRSRSGSQPSREVLLEAVERKVVCEARGIPFAYLADVIPRVQEHPKRRLDELLPGPWA